MKLQTTDLAETVVWACHDCPERGYSHQRPDRAKTHASTKPGHRVQLQTRTVQLIQAKEPAQ